MPPFEAGLHLITDRASFPAPSTDDVFDVHEWAALDAAVGAGVGAVQLREKDLEGRALLGRARAMVERCRGTSTRVLVNDRVDVALAAGADGVHLPESAMAVADARALMRGHDPTFRRWIGRSLHAVDALDDAVSPSSGSTPDFVQFGPVYDTPSKRVYGEPQGLRRLTEFCARSTVPVIAVGGITPERVDEVVQCGAHGVAVIRAVWKADDVACAVSDFRDALADAIRPRT